MRDFLKSIFYSFGLVNHLTLHNGVCAKMCSYDGNTYNPGDTVQTYASDAPICPTNCYKVTATCQSDGTWDKTMYVSCSPKKSGDCSDYPLLSKNASNAKSYTGCTYYTLVYLSLYDEQGECLERNAYRITECEEGYQLSDDGKSCDPLPTPECGGSRGECAKGTFSGYSINQEKYKTRECVGSGTVTCQYKCTTTTVGATCDCPMGYELNTAGTKCNFVGIKFCGREMCSCSNEGTSWATPCKCIAGTYADHGSQYCFGDTSQKVSGTLGLRPNLSKGSWLGGGMGSYVFNAYNNGDHEYQFNYYGNMEASSALCNKSDYDENYYRNNCELVHYNDGTSTAEYDNGYYLTNCSGVSSTADACCAGGTTTETCEVTTLSSCFPAGTKITMADGSKRNIEDIQAGDMVFTYNEVTHKFEPNEVVEPIVHPDSTDEMYELTIDGEILKVTYSHRFYVAIPTENDEKGQCNISYEWISAQDLKVGDLLFMSNGKYTEVEAISHHPNVETVYNLSVANNHNYFVGDGYLVHNRKIDNPILIEP